MLHYLKSKFFKLLEYFIWPCIEEKAVLLIDKRVSASVQLAMQWYDYSHAKDDMLASNIEAKTEISDLIQRFRNLGIPVLEESIDIADFELWCDRFQSIVKFYENNSGEASIEKCLEHYLTMRYLDVEEADVVIDVAACSSPWTDILREYFGQSAYRQDLIFQSGIHGNTIGGNAGDMPVSDEFADVLTLHCAYECFQGDSDIAFIREAGRVLKNDGRLGIIPLYVDSIYFVKTGYKVDQRCIEVDDGAKLIWRDDKYVSTPFSRHYSPEAFKQRVYDNLGPLKGQIFYFTNLHDIETYYPGQRVYCHFMFKAFKDNS